MQKSFDGSFEKLLEKLLEQKYISEENYQDVRTGFQQYVREEQLRMDTEKKKREEEKARKIQKSVKPIKEKKKHTPEQLRERNLGVMLYLGVFLLLLGGLFVATSNWESMQGWMKAGVIILVSFLFFGFGFLTKEMIKIQKTAFAFFVLGGLFLPIVFISISYFHLAGFYLSFIGEGRYLLGVIAGILLIPIYLYLSLYLHSKLFKVLTILTLTGTIGFMLSFLHVNMDVFFLSMIIYHFLLLLLLLKGGNHKWVLYFTKELPTIIQTQLLFITIFMLFIYDQILLNGFQYILLSALFFMSVALTKQKNTHFIITLTITLGIYRLFSNELVRDMLPIAFAALSIVVIWFTYFLKGRVAWGKIWDTTSLVLAIGTFLYSIVFYVDRLLYGSFYLVIAYILLSLQFLILTKKLSSRFISILPAIFLSLSLWHISLLFDLVSDIHSLFMVLYAIHFLLLMVIGILYTNQYVQSIKLPSAFYLFAWISMITILAGTIFLGKWYIPFMIIGITMSLLYGYRFTVKEDVRNFLHFTIPASIACFFVSLVESVPFIHEEGIFLSLALAGIFTTVSVSIYRKISLQMTKVAYLIGHVIYILAMVGTFTSFVEYNNWISTTIFLVGIFMLLTSYKKQKQLWIVWLVGVVSTVSYLSLILTIWDQGDYIFSILLRYGWIVIFCLSIYLSKTVFKYPFLTLSHCYLIISILVSWFIDGTVPYTVFLFSLLAYIITSVIVPHVNWKLFFQYGSYLWTFFFLARVIPFHLAGGNSFALAFISTSILLFLLYVGTKRKHIVYFYIPFSFFGISYWLFAWPYSVYTYLIITCYILLFLFVINISRIHLAGIIAVCFILFNNQLWIHHGDFLPFDSYLLHGAWGLLFWFISSISYPSFFSWKKDKWVDMYILGSFLSIASLYTISTPFAWDSIFPGLLLAIVLFVQRNRVEHHYRWLPTLLSLLLLLQPYYAWLNILSIPTIINTEMYVLPWIPLLLLLKKWIANHERMFKIAEWSIVVCIAIVLAIDGWNSHTIQDAILLGSLAVISIIGGFYFRLKSYFFTGIGVLLLNVILQTMPLWGNFPWWVYLLIAGSLLIVMASVYEMKKQGKRIKLVSSIYIWTVDKIKQLKSWR